jgi:hypothetical protein
MKSHQLTEGNRHAQKNKRRKKDDRSLLAILSFFAITIVLVLQFNHRRTVYPPFYASTTAFVDPEHAHPSSYLAANGFYRPDNWVDKGIITGTIINNARHTTYRNIHLKVRFLNAADIVVSVQEYILSEAVPYGTTNTFRLKIRRPLSAVACAWTAVDAEKEGVSK